MADTGIQPYSTARVDYLARYLQTQLPGLNYTLAVKWINAERGVNGNVLGVTYDSSSASGYQGKLRTYSSQEEGLRAAAALIKSSGNYAGVRASLGKSYEDQARALVASPWNVRNSPYYARLFGVGTLSSQPNSTSVPSVPTATEVAARAPNLWTYLGKKPSDVLTDADIAKLVAGYHQVGYGSIVESTIVPILNGYKGRRLDAIPAGVKIDSQHPEFSFVPWSAQEWLLENTPVGPLVDTAETVAAVGAFLFDVENWQYIGALVIGVPLAIFGFYLLAGAPTAGQNA